MGSLLVKFEESCLDDRAISNECHAGSMMSYASLLREASFCTGLLVFTVNSGDILVFPSSFKGNLPKGSV